MASGSPPPPQAWPDGPIISMRNRKVRRVRFITWCFKVSKAALHCAYRLGSVCFISSIFFSCSAACRMNSFSFVLHSDICCSTLAAIQGAPQELSSALYSSHDFRSAFGKWMPWSFSSIMQALGSVTHRSSFIHADTSVCGQYHGFELGQHFPSVHELPLYGTGICSIFFSMSEDFLILIKSNKIIP